MTVSGASPLASEAPGWVAAELRASLPPAPAAARDRPVSIVVPTHEGQELLARLLDGLAHRTDHSDFEVVVVDGASQDGTAPMLAGLEVPFPLTVVRTARNGSFSAACNTGAARALHDLLLFLNDDVEPIEPGWLRRLVAARERAGGGATGAVLLDPSSTSSRGRPGAVQHHGVVFTERRGALRPVLRGLGDDLTDVLGPDREAAAVAAACLLVSRHDLVRAGGFSERFWFGAEDVDLGLRLRSQGRPVTVCGTAVLWHRPGSTRAAMPAAREAGEANHRLLLERWGPAIRREHELDAARGTAVYALPGTAPTDPSARVRFCVRPGPGVPGPAVEELVGGLAEAGQVAAADPGTDGWLLDDVVVHLRAGRGRFPVIPGRLSVLLEVGEDAAPAVEAARFDLVLPRGTTPAQLADAVAESLRAAGGPRRVEPRRWPAQALASHAAAAARTAVVVLGMARTGSSATMRMLHALGVDVAADEALLGPIAHVNPKGFYEHYAIMRINTMLLQRTGGSWDAPPALPPGWEEDPALDDLREEAARILAEDFPGSGAWGFKDPRTSLTLPFWRPLIGPARFVICHRNPLEIAASVERRDGIPVKDSLAVWRRYAADAVAHTAGDERVFVAYEQLLREPVAVADDLSAFLGLGDRAADPEVREEIARWVEGGLRHHASSLGEALEHPALDEDARQLLLLYELATQERRPRVQAPLDRTALRVLHALGARAASA